VNQPRNALLVSQIREAMPEQLRDAVVLEVMESIDSTSDELSRRSRKADVSGCVVLAEQQTAGRGRRGRVWSSPAMKNVYLSLAWRMDLEPQDLAGLSLALGCSVAEALERDVLSIAAAKAAIATGKPAVETANLLQLKWPNDVYANHRKLGGIIVDLANASDGGVTVIAGIGINVLMAGDDDVGVDQPFIGLMELITSREKPVGDERSAEVGAVGGAEEAPWVALDRNRVAASIIEAAVGVLQAWNTSGFSFWQGAWQGRDMMLGQRVSIIGAESIEGIARGVNAEGALLIETAEGLKTVWGGDVSLRRQVQESV
jgi:BirA family biotin operon repressor/biotin-[acetyl-CoA-carboxylase] ligase